MPSRSCGCSALLRSRPTTLNEDEMASLRRIIGGSGTDAASRLGLQPDAPFDGPRSAFAAAQALAAPGRSSAQRSVHHAGLPGRGAKCRGTGRRVLVAPVLNLTYPGLNDLGLSVDIQVCVIAWGCPWGRPIWWRSPIMRRWCGGQCSPCPRIAGRGRRAVVPVDGDGLVFTDFVGTGGRPGAAGRRRWFDASRRTVTGRRRRGADAGDQPGASSRGVGAARFPRIGVVVPLRSVRRALPGVRVVSRFGRRADGHPGASGPARARRRRSRAISVVPAPA